MNLIDSTSMVKTLDNLNERLLFTVPVSHGEGLELARWIVSRHGEKGSYRGMFAPTLTDFTQGIRLFTGERLFSASARHIMGQEAARALWLLGREDATILDIYSQATAWMQDHPEFSQTGTFCCGRCTIAFWRHVWIGDFINKSDSLTKGLQAMGALRTGDGHWRNIPFFYAIYTLHDMELEPALEELRYARPVMENYLKRRHEDQYSKRKSAILAKALDRVS